MAPGKAESSASPAVSVDSSLGRRCQRGDTRTFGARLCWLYTSFLCTAPSYALPKAHRRSQAPHPRTLPNAHWRSFGRYALSRSQLWRKVLVVFTLHTLLSSGPLTLRSCFPLPFYYLSGTLYPPPTTSCFSSFGVLVPKTPRYPSRWSL